MPVLSVEALTVSFGQTPLFQEVNLQVDEGEHIALVGRNGAGKSTFLKILAGEIAQDAGSVRLGAGQRIAMVSQTVPVGLRGSVFDVVAEGIAAIGGLLKHYHEITTQLAIAFTDELLEKQGAIAQKIDACDGWLFQQKIETVLSKLDLNGDALIENLSGGLKRRVLLAQALVSDPDVLLLDEPTNHLDIEAVLWLETFLKNYPKTFILITHDRQFMANLATRIIEIDYQSLFSWPGNYEKYCRLKAELIVAQEREQALFDKKLAIEETWIRQGIKARRTRNEGRVRRLEAMRREKEMQFKQTGKSTIEIQTDRLSGKIVFEIENLSFSYSEKNIINDFSAIIARGDCIGIVGPNGAGKSTLIKLLLGDLTPTKGSIKCGTNLEIAYFDQYRFELNEQETLIDNVGMGREKITINGKDKHVISYLQDFLFTPDRARVKVSLLSGGEKNRLLLAKLFSKPANLIVMDEPTNDLDIETLELLEEKLSEFSGTLIVISHDRVFLNNIATQLWVMQPNGQIQEYVGGHVNWDALMPAKNSEKIVEKKPEKLKESAPKKEKLTFEERKELSALPNKITSLESKITASQNEMLVQTFYQQSQDKIKAHTEKLGALESDLAKCYARWEQLESREH